MTLDSLGWNDGFAAAFQAFSNDGFLPARVALEHKHAYELLSPLGEPGTQAVREGIIPL